MPDTDLSDIGDVLASRLAEIGVDPEGDAPLNLPSSATSNDTPAGDDLVAQTLKAGEQHDDATPPAQTPPAASAPVATATTAAAATDSASAPPAVMAYLRDKYGADFSQKYQSDEAFLQGVINLNRKLGERDEEAQLGRVLKEDPARVAQWLVQQRPDLFPKPEPKADPQPQAKTPPTQFSPAWFKALAIKPDAPPELKAEIEQWAQNEALANTPIGQQLRQTQAELNQLKQYLSQGAPQAVGDVDAKLAAFQQEQAAKEFITVNQSWLFTENNGVRVLSPDGFIYKQALEEAHQSGAPFEMAKKYADNALAVHRAKHASNGTKAPAVPAAAARQPAPAVPATEDTKDWIRDGEDLEAALFRNLKREGLLDSLAQAY